MTTVIQLATPGGSEPLTPTEITLADPGPGQVRIRQTVIGVNFVDIYYRRGLYPLPTLPVVLGVEGAGRVEAIGPDVSRLHVGDRVAYAGLPLGGYAEARNLPASRLIPLPAALSDRVAGSSMLRGLTAHMLLRKVYAIAPGDWVLVHAAAGGLGQFVTRWARRLGAHVIGTVGSEPKKVYAYQAGATAVLLHTDPDWVAQVRALAEGEGVHLAVDGIGGSLLVQTLAAVRPFGIAASLGQPAGPIPPVRMEELGAGRALMRPSVLAYANDPVLYAQGARELLAALQDGLENPVGAEYALADAEAAHRDLEGRRTTGSVILTV
ncbi:MAG: quinone oxidoreductase family protein [Acidiferrobacteraceae bacterium]